MRLTNGQLDALWEVRRTLGTGVSYFEEGHGKDSDYMTICLDGCDPRIFERKPNATQWKEVM